jgi:hypothetical protein
LRCNEAQAPCYIMLGAESRGFCGARIRQCGRAISVALPERKHLHGRIVATEVAFAVYM